MTDTPHPAPDLVQRLRKTDKWARQIGYPDLSALLREAADALAQARDGQATPVAWRRRYLKPTGDWVYSGIFTPINPELGPQEDQPLYAHPPATEPAPPAGKGDALREALERIIDAADSPAARGGEMWFAEAVSGPIEEARAVLKDTP